MGRPERWTEDEDDILLASSSYDDYVRRAGPLARTPTSVANRRSRLKTNGATLPKWYPGEAPVVYAKDGGRIHIAQPESRLESQPETLELPERGDLALEEYYGLVKQISNVQRARKAETRTIEWTAPVDGWVGIAFPGDLHIGGPIDYDQLEADLDLIEATDGLWCVGLGDYSNNFQAAAKLLKAMADDVAPASEDQMALVAHVMGRTSKWLGILEGNHDSWSGSGGLKTLSAALGCPFVSEAGCSLKVQAGSQRYVGYLKHQWTGHSQLSTSNSGRRMAAEFNDWERADFTCTAHFHQPDTHQKEANGRTIVHLRGGTYKSFDTYATSKGYIPEYGIPLILLNPDHHEIIPFHARNWRRGLDLLNMLRS